MYNSQSQNTKPPTLDPNSPLCLCLVDLSSAVLRMQQVGFDGTVLDFKSWIRYSDPKSYTLAPALGHPPNLDPKIKRSTLNRCTPHIKLTSTKLILQSQHKMFKLIRKFNLRGLNNTHLEHYLYLTTILRGFRPHTQTPKTKTLNPNPKP